MSAQYQRQSLCRIALTQNQQDLVAKSLDLMIIWQETESHQVPLILLLGYSKNICVCVCVCTILFLIPKLLQFYWLQSFKTVDLFYTENKETTTLMHKNIICFFSFSFIMKCTK